MNIAILRALLALAPIIPQLASDVEAELAVFQSTATLSTKAQQSLDGLVGIIKLLEGLL